jgi:two-component system, chemotaxis family, protein-glutamate methylesterase/glutaminase
MRSSGVGSAGVETDTPERAAPARVVGIGASAGGVDALTRLVRRLPSQLPVAVCIVLHVPATGRSLLGEILARHTELEVEVAGEGEPVRSGRIYVAPADRHLTVEDGRLRLDRGPKENGVRPAVDPMLRSLAASYGERAVAVVLSGALGDGSSGALAVRHAGGTVLVQDPGDAIVPSMPESALRAIGDADEVLPAEELGLALTRLTDGATQIEKDVVMPIAGDSLAESPERPPGPPSGLTCPECNGPLWEAREGDVTRYRCRVGHGFSEDSLVVEQGSAVEAALWSALEALEERAEFLRRLAERHAETRPRMRDRYSAAATDALDRATLIRKALGIRTDRPHALDLQPEAAAE